MLSRLKIRTGISGVLAVFVASLFASGLMAWHGASVSDSQIEALNQLTVQQLDRLNSAAILATRASASNHTSALERHAGRGSAVVEKGLKNSVERIAKARELIAATVASIKEPSMQGAALALQQRFEVYIQAIARQMEVVRSGSLIEYSIGHDNTREASVAYAEARETLTHLITEHIQRVMQASDERLLLAQMGASGLIVLAILLALSSGWFVTTQILRPLEEAGDCFKSIAAGNLGQAIEPRGDNEIGALFSALEHMRQSQRDTLLHLSQTATQLTQAATTLGLVTQQTTEGVQQQYAELEQAVEAVSNMTQAIESVAGMAVSTSDTAALSDRLAQSSRQQVSKTLAEIETMGLEVQQAGTVVQQLAEQAQNIGTFLEVIRSVSEQINLLALNAAIEAARAGDAGRGFAVVADEVRTLAGRTQQSTQEIERMVSSIQSSSATAVESIQATNSRTLGTLENTRATGQVLEEMFRSIGQINACSQNIAQAAGEQAEVSREVDRNLSTLRTLAARSNAGAHETRNASGDLTRLAGEINRLVQRFQL